MPLVGQGLSVLQDELEGQRRERDGWLTHDSSLAESFLVRILFRMDSKGKRETPLRSCPWTTGLHGEGWVAYTFLLDV